VDYYVSLDGLKTEKQLASWIVLGKEYAEKSPPKKKVAKKRKLKLNDCLKTFVHWP